jgi:hypothetical protein
MTSFQDQIVSYESAKLKEAQGYQQLLRAVGQALEKNNLLSFELTPAENGFRIRPSTGSLLEAIAAESSARRVNPLLRNLTNHHEGEERLPLATKALESPVEIEFIMADIQRLEIDGRGRRIDGHLMANAASLSQVLRCLGAYLNQKRARLLRFTRDGETVSLEYESSLGSQIKESFSAKDLYDMWVRMYMQRTGRLNHKFSATES